MKKHLAEHSLLTKVGCLVFFSCLIGSHVVYFIVGEYNINIYLTMFAVLYLGAVLIMAGLLT